MAVSWRSEVGALRLNPFAFPSETDFRFVLLIVTVVSACLFIYNAFWLGAGGGQALVAANARCAPLAPQVPSREQLSNPLNDPSEITRRTEAYQRCTAAVWRSDALWMGAGVALLLGVAAVLYWVYPAWRIRRRRLEPLPAEDAPEAIAYLGQLCDEAGLVRRPSFLVDPLNRSTTGLAFGHLGRYYVALAGGLIAQFYRDRPAFRAVVLHELAHLRNADIDKTYFSVTTWYAFLFVALLPYAFTLLNTSIGYVIDLGWRLFALGTVIYLTRSALLRAREVYADVRASVWDGPGGSLGRMLERLPGPLSRWRALLQSHPAPAERRSTLQDTRPLFELGFWEAVGTGLAAMLAFSGIDPLLANLTAGRNVAVLAPLLGAIILAPLVVGVLGVGVWRSTFAALAQGQRPRGAARTALGFAIGCLIGRVVALEFALHTFSGRPPSATAGFVVAHIVWGVLLFGSVLLLLRWVAAGAVVWLEATADRESVRPAYRTGLALAGGVFILCFTVLFPAIRAIGMTSSGSEIEAAMVSVTVPSTIGDLISTAAASNPTVSTVLVPIALILGFVYLLPGALKVLALISFWAFPFAALLWRESQATAGSHWAFLDEPSRRLTVPAHEQMSPRAAWRAGLWAGAIFCALLLALRLAWRLGIDEATRSQDLNKLQFLYAQLALGVVVQAGAAAIAAGRARRLHVIHGAFAAFVAGCIAAVAVLGLNLAFGGTIDAPFAWIVFSLTLQLGGLPALTAAALAAGLLRRRRKTEVVNP